MVTNLNVLLNRLRDPEYSHLLLEPLPLFGLLFGLLFFAIGLYLKQDKCRIAALVVIAVTCGSAMLYGKLRQRALPGILRDSPGKVVVVREQTELRKRTLWVYYVTGGFALLALVGGGKLGAWSNVVLLVGGTFALIFSTWLHLKEAEVYHPNIKKSIRKA